MIDFRPSLDQAQIVDSVTRYLQRNYPLERFQSNRAPAKTVHTAWPELAEQGIFGLAASEKIGGSGFTVVEEMLTHRELGRALVSPSVLATALAVHLAQDANLPALATSLVMGERRVGFGLQRGNLSVGANVDGSLHLIDSDAGGLVLIRTQDGLALIAREDLCEIEPVGSLDESVTLHRARAEAVKTVAHLSAVSGDLQKRSTLLFAASLVGMAEATRDLAVAHARMREQFGKPIGSFQAVAHHCSDMETRARAARAETAFAAMALCDQRADAPFHIQAAAIIAADAAIRNATMAIRVLGGMGFTAECALHLYLKRAHLYERLGGGTRAHKKDILQYEGDLLMPSA
jgi:alkylation response protein AidB-like acyl-CoA dehydrogenase